MSGIEDRRAPRLWYGLGPLVLVALALPWITPGIPRDPDETRYLEIPREMLETSDWIVPQLNYIPYLEKPPLYYWMVAVAFKLFGTSVVPARLVSLACGAGVVLFVSILGSRLWDQRTGIRAGLILATCPFFVALSSIVTIDMPFVFWLTGALTLFVMGSLDRRSSAQGWLRNDATFLGAYALLGLAVLTKGPVALLFPGLLWAFWLGKSRRPVLPPRFLLGSAVVLAVSAPWFARIAWETPEFLDFFFVRGHVSRLLSARDASQISIHSQPFYSYIPVLLGGAFPWVLWLAVPLRRLRDELAPGSPTRMAWSWLVPAFLALSLIPAKLPTYVLPLFAPVALLAARRWEEASASMLSRRLLRGIAAVVSCAVLIGLIVAWSILLVRGAHPRAAQIPRGVAVLGSCFAALATLAAAFSLWRAQFRTAFGGFVAMSCGTIILGAVLKVPLDRAECISAVLPALREFRRPDEPVVCVRRLYPGVPFYLGSPAHVYGGRGELAFGSETLGRGRDLFPSRESLAEWSRGPNRVFFTVLTRRLRRLESELGIALHVLEERGGVALVSNHATPWRGGAAPDN